MLEFIYSSNRFTTKGGLMAGTATTHYYASEEFKLKQEKTRSYTCSPETVIAGGDYKQSTYCHLLLGLHFSDSIEFVTSTFAYTLVQVRIHVFLEYTLIRHVHHFPYVEVGNSKYGMLEYDLYSILHHANIDKIWTLLLAACKQ